MLNVIGCLGIARALLLLVPFKHIAPRLGTQTASQPDDLDVNDPPAWAHRIAWAIATAARHTPWKSACLVQSITGKYLLKRRGLRTHLFLGMRRDPDGNVSAHAWLKAGNTILIGAKNHESFTVLSVFTDSGLPLR